MARYVKIIILVLIIIGGYWYQGKKLGRKPVDLKIKEAKRVENITLNAKIKTDRGDINLKLFPEVAPMTITSFVTLAKKGFYNGLKFHRVIEDFMIQGGDPTGTGAGGPGYQFRDEFKEGVVFDKKGLLAMANAGPNTNGSQFFITHVPTEWLNYKHTIFGEVVSEEDQKVVDSIKQGDKIESIEITGDVDKFLAEQGDLVKNINEILEKTMPELNK
ncbi:peptidylprolyl isomerase [Fusobacterium hominis]|uniref:Peptidyl-prolyl cis-trans isomerase n=1 Tax=Fusobacterium hominis TaxID=2764326 RepID=A0A7G9GZ99_9FUSO|nr:peptidylprolyl isomerase [Fusobacterium hominis]